MGGKHRKGWLGCAVIVLGAGITSGLLLAAGAYIGMHG